MIDIIIPIYNAQETLPLTLMSIYLQKVSVPYHVTLMDDCSMDGYDEILEKFKDLIPLTYHRLEVNGGAGVARQRGIEMTHGEYITFIDADDYFYDVDSLESLYQEIQKGFDLVEGNEYDEKNDDIQMNISNLHAKIYRRSYLEEKHIQFNSTRIHEDNYFNNYVLLSGAKEIILDRCCYLYSYNQNSISQVSEDLEFQRVEILLSNMAEIINHVPVTEENKTFYMVFFFTKYSHLNNWYLDESKKDQLKEWVLKYDPEHVSFLGVRPRTNLMKTIMNYFNKK